MVVTLPADADETKARDIKIFDYRKELSLPLPPSSDRRPEPVQKLDIGMFTVWGLFSLAGFCVFIYFAINNFITASKCDSIANQANFDKDACKEINNSQGGGLLGVSVLALLSSICFLGAIFLNRGYPFKPLFNNIKQSIKSSFKDIKHPLKSYNASQQQEAYLKSLGQDKAPKEARDALMDEYQTIRDMIITGVGRSRPSELSKTNAFIKLLLTEVEALCKTQKEYDSCKRKLVSIVPPLLWHYSLDPAKLDASDWAVRFKEVAEQLKESNRNQNNPFKLYNETHAKHNHTVIKNVFHPFAVDHNLYYRIDTLFSGNADGTFNATKDVRPKLLLMVRQPHTGQSKSFAAKIEYERESSSSESSSMYV